MVADAYLDGTYSEADNDIDQSDDGLWALFRQFSFPGGISSLVATVVGDGEAETGPLATAWHSNKF